MSDVRWEPLEDGDHSGGNGEIITTKGRELEVVGDRDNAAFITLPPDIRLCRAVAAQWSQEPGDDYPFQWPMSIAVRTALGELCDEIFLARHGDVVMEHYGKLVRNWLLKLPATVPPPGEVGP